jgi:hypothetical protein
MESTMNFPVTIPGMEGQNVEVVVNFWSAAQLLVNGEPSPKGNSRKEYLLQKNDGTTCIVSWKSQLFGFDIPQLFVDNQIIQVVEPLKWYQIAWIVFPVSLLFVGGALGAACGLLGFYCNAQVFRSNLSGILKYLISAGISILALVVYVTCGSLLTDFLPK